MQTEQNEALQAQQQVVRLQALLEAGRQIHATIELDEVIRTVLRIVVREIEMSGAYLAGMPHSYGDVPPVGQREAADGSPLAANTVRFPLRDKHGVTFTELVAIGYEGRTLDFDELDFLESLAVQASAAIENARFHARAVEWHRLESDLASARNVQRSLLPQTMPQLDGYTLAMRSVACYAVGGDYLDIVDPVEPNGKTTIVVADVAGKGLTSALVGMSFRSAFRAMVLAGVPLLDIATRMNLLQYGESEESRRRYVTAILLQLDPIAHTIQVVSAGHNPAFLVSKSGGDSSVQTIRASGTPIGMLPFSSYAVEEFRLEPGARLLLYTDGLTEVFHGEEEFGEDRLLQTFAECSETTSEAVLDSLWATLDNFSDGSEQSDDMTALVLLRQA